MAFVSSAPRSPQPQRQTQQGHSPRATLTDHVPRWISGNSASNPWLGRPPPTPAGSLATGVRARDEGRRAGDGAGRGWEAADDGAKRIGRRSSPDARVHHADPVGAGILHRARADDPRSAAVRHRLAGGGFRGGRRRYRGVQHQPRCYCVPWPGGWPTDGAVGG